MRYHLALAVAVGTPVRGQNSSVHTQTGIPIPTTINVATVRLEVAIVVLPGKLWRSGDGNMGLRRGPKVRVYQAKHDLQVTQKLMPFNVAVQQQANFMTK